MKTARARKRNAPRCTQQNIEAWGIERPPTSAEANAACNALLDLEFSDETPILGGMKGWDEPAGVEYQDIEDKPKKRGRARKPAAVPPKALETTLFVPGHLDKCKVHSSLEDDSTARRLGHGEVSVVKPFSERYHSTSSKGNILGTLQLHDTKNVAAKPDRQVLPFRRAPPATAQGRAQGFARWLQDSPKANRIVSENANEPILQSDPLKENSRAAYDPGEVNLEPLRQVLASREEPPTRNRRKLLYSNVTPKDKVTQPPKKQQSISRVNPFAASMEANIPFNEASVSASVVSTSEKMTTSSSPGSLSSILQKANHYPTDIRTILSQYYAQNNKAKAAVPENLKKAMAEQQSSSSPRSGQSYLKPLRTNDAVTNTDLDLALDGSQTERVVPLARDIHSPKFITSSLKSPQKHTGYITSKLRLAKATVNDLNALQGGGWSPFSPLVSDVDARRSHLADRLNQRRNAPT